MKTYPLPKFDVGDVFRWVNGKKYRILDVYYNDRRYVYMGHKGISTADIDRVDSKAWKA